MKHFSFAQFLRNNRIFLIFIFLLIFFRAACADWSPVPTGSMEPTVLPGDVVWVDKTAFGPTIPFLNKRIATWGHPSRGDIITFVPPHTDQLFVKRVIAKPGDNIRIEGNRIFINGVQLEQHLTGETDHAILGIEFIDGKEHRIQLSKGRRSPYIGRTITVPRGKYFVMGDHRNDSQDSRYWGFVDEEKIMGRVTAIAVSFSSQRDWSERIALPLE